MPPLRLLFAAVITIISAVACVVAWAAAPLYSPAEVRAEASIVPAASTQSPPAASAQPPPVDPPGWGEQASPSDAQTVARYANGSVVVEQRFWSAALAREMHYRLYLPPGYSFEGRDYPVLYMLHGVAGGSSEWEDLGLLEAADRLIAAGEIDPLLIVLPDGGPNYWVDHADGARWGDFVVADIVPSVDRLYRTQPEPAARAIGGLSMGGEGALRIALLHPDVFSIAAAHAPSLRTSYDQLSEELQVLYGDPDRWRSLSPYWLVANGDAAERLMIWVDVGTDDPWRENAEALHERLEAYGIEHQFAVLEGEHDASYWEAHLGRFLRFYSDAFAWHAATEGSLEPAQVGDFGLVEYDAADDGSLGP